MTIRTATTAAATATTSSSDRVADATWRARASLDDADDQGRVIMRCGVWLT